MQFLVTAALILLLLLIVAILGLFIRALVTRELQQKDLLIQDLRGDNQLLMAENKGLLNRLMSPDLSTFATMTALTIAAPASRGKAEGVHNLLIGGRIRQRSVGRDVGVE